MESAVTEEPLHTDEVQDIISNPPVWIYRWGTSLFLGIIGMCIIGAALISYPEVVKTQLKIISVNLPLTVTLKDEAKLLKIEVQNEQEVKQGQILAILENKQGKTTVIAPANGKITYAGIIHENQVFAANQNIFYITADSGGFYGEMLIPKSNVTSVKPGQAVLIKLKDYPYQEYGVLEGKIRYITAVQPTGGMVAEVDFKKVKTNRNKAIVLKHGSLADADIITANASLLSRLTKSMIKGVR